MQEAERQTVLKTMLQTAQAALEVKQHLMLRAVRRRVSHEVHKQLLEQTTNKLAVALAPIIKEQGRSIARGLRRLDKSVLYQVKSAAKEPPSYIKIELPLVRQENTYYCGPACVVSIVGYYQPEPPTQDDIAKLAETTKDGTSPEGIVQAIAKHGIRGEARQNLMIQDLIDSVDAGNPVIVDLQAWGDPKKYPERKDGHYIVMVGYDAERLYFMDPSVADDYGYLDRDELMGRWFDRSAEGEDQNRLGIICTKINLDNTKTAGPHKFASTQVNLPEPIASRILAMGFQIPNDDLAADGREGEVHCTIRYGLEDDDPTGVISIASSHHPIRLRLGKTSIFPASEKQLQHGDEMYDVVKIDVESEDAKQLNEDLAQLPHTETHKDYHSHITLAYVKAGAGQKYVGMVDVDGEEVVIDYLKFSPRASEPTWIKLVGKKSSSTNQRYKENSDGDTEGSDTRQKDHGPTPEGGEHRADGESALLGKSGLLAQPGDEEAGGLLREGGDRGAGARSDGSGSECVPGGHPLGIAGALSADGYCLEQAVLRGLSRRDRRGRPIHGVGPGGAGAEGLRDDGHPQAYPQGDGGPRGLPPARAVHCSGDGRSVVLRPLGELDTKATSSKLIKQAFDPDEWRKKITNAALPVLAVGMAKAVKGQFMALG
jgi:predicted double-glycine peptidase